MFQSLKNVQPTFMPFVTIRNKRCQSPFISPFAKGDYTSLEQKPLKASPPFKKEVVTNVTGGLMRVLRK